MSNETWPENGPKKEEAEVKKDRYAFGRVLQKLRVSGGWSISQAAQIFGVDRLKYANFESGDVLPNKAQLEAILNIFKLNNNELNQAFQESKAGLEDEIEKRRIAKGYKK